MTEPLAAPGRLVRLVDWYQRAMDGRPSPCRFTPSCSSYAREALAEHGTRRGLWLTVRRLVRCRPFGPSGYDPVPESVGREAHALQSLRCEERSDEWLSGRAPRTRDTSPRPLGSSSEPLMTSVAHHHGAAVRPIAKDR